MTRNRSLYDQKQAKIRESQGTAVATQAQVPVYDDPAVEATSQPLWRSRLTCTQLPERREFISRADLRASRPANDETKIDRRKLCAALNTALAWFDEPGIVYFLKMHGFDLVKIGYSSRDDGYRIRRLQTACPFTLDPLLIIPGGSALEGDLHAAFRRYRAKGEWFTLTPTIAEFIRLAPKLHKRWLKANSSIPSSSSAETLPGGAE